MKGGQGWSEARVSPRGFSYKLCPTFGTLKCCDPVLVSGIPCVPFSQPIYVSVASRPDF